MKKILNILLAALLLTSCSDELLPDFLQKEDGNKVTVKFSVTTPAGEDVATRAFNSLDPDDPSNNDASINAYRNNLNVWLYVFDREGFFVEAAQAENKRTGQTSNGVTQTDFEVKLTKSSAKRIVHFVAYTNANESQNDFGYESNMMRKMVTKMTDAAPDGYWQRREVSKIDENTTFKRVPLVRNFVKADVVKDASLADSKFILDGFYVVGTPQQGSLVAFNGNNGAFAHFEKDDQEENKLYTDLLAEGYVGYTPTGTEYDFTVPDKNSPAYTKASKYFFETPNAVGDTKGKTVVIVKGRYDKNGNAASATPTFYKLDFVYSIDEGNDITYGNAYYNLLRNFKYTFNIHDVVFGGYSTPQEAYEKPATNNISASVQAASVNNISDEFNRLFVNNQYIVISEGGTYTNLLRYKFKELNEDNYMNDIISIHALGDDIFNTPPEMASTNDDDDHYRNVKLDMKEVGNEPLTATLRFYVNKKSAAFQSLTDEQKAKFGEELLFRDVTVVLRKPYPMRLECPLTVAATAGTELEADIYIPQGLNEKLFPLTFYLEPASTSIYPDASKSYMPVHLANSIVPGKEGSKSFQYERILTKEEYDGLTVSGNSKVLPCHFKTNTAASATTIYVVNARSLFTPAHAAFSNGTAVFANLHPTITGTEYFGTNHPVTISWDMAVARTVTLTITEGTTTSTYTVTNTTTGVNTYTYRTKTFDDGDISVEITYADANNGNQVIAAENTTRRHILWLPVGAFQTNLPASDGPSIYIVEQKGATTLNHRAGWDNMDQRGILPREDPYQDGFILDADRVRNAETSAQGVTITRNSKLRFEGWNNAGWWAEITVGAVVDAYANDLAAGYSPTVTTTTDGAVTIDESGAPANGLFRLQLTFNQP